MTRCRRECTGAESRINQEWWLGLTVESAALGTKASEGKRQLVLRTPRTFGMQYSAVRSSSNCYFTNIPYIG